MYNQTKRFTKFSKSHDSEDYIAAGNLGLLKSITSYDLSKGSTFASWSKYPILREILATVRSIDHTTIPQGAFEARNKVRRVFEELELRLGREPTIEEVSAESGVSESVADSILNVVKLTSLQATSSSYEDEDLYLENIISGNDASTEDRVLYEMEINALKTFGMSILTEQERIILVRTTGLDGEPPMKLLALGAYIGRCRETIRQEKNKALAKLKHPSVLAKLYWESRVD